MALRRFGAGVLFGVGPNATDTPVAFGALQDVALDFQYTNKMLYGSNIFPEAVGRGEGKLTGKAKFGRVTGNLYNSLFFGQTLSTGMTKVVNLEGGPNGTPIPATPFQITVVNSANFVSDLGVINMGNGLPLKKVAAAPIAGQYSVAAGVYLFASADNVSGIKVGISYTWTDSANGVSIDVFNTVQGIAPQFGMFLYNPDPDGTVGHQSTAICYSCVSNKLSLPTKQADWGITELDWDCQPNGAGKIATFSFSE